MKDTFMLLAACALALTSQAAVRETVPFDRDWQFAFGNAASPEKDFGNATEYFTYMTKAASVHNEGPYAPKYDTAGPDSTRWRKVNLPHDWVVDLPYDSAASHSHGYKTVGWQWPETSVGWYRKTFDIDSTDMGRHIYLQLDGVHRDSRVWVNGFYLGHEPSGYATRTYDMTDYLNYGGTNTVAVRADASVEEGWFYEGAGIYRHTWLVKTSPVHIEPFGIATSTTFDPARPDRAMLTVSTELRNDSRVPDTHASVRHTLRDARGRTVATSTPTGASVPLRGTTEVAVNMEVDNPMLWSTDSPYLYTLTTEVLGADGTVLDNVDTRVGFRTIEFDPDRGFLLNGQRVPLRGVNMHQDHPGVGSAIPDAVQAYRLRELKKMGVNAYRASHNPMTPAMLDACDSLGILVVEENRLMGVNDEHIALLERMIRRDRNHPSIIAWSVGNEEWGIEWNRQGEEIVATMRDHVHRLDPTRPATAATSGGPATILNADVAGYNYVVQNPIDDYRMRYPSRRAMGSEETTGCGTRGIYTTDHATGRMAAHNRRPNGPDSLVNCIERGMRFYAERPWLSGLFFWTGFDYRGEPNPMVFPATGSQFGLLDYCGFPKDEAFYVKACWTDEPVLHLLPHWNLEGCEGDSVSVWAYTNCDDVELFVNGRSQGRRSVEPMSHAEWRTVYRPGEIRAIGRRNGRKVAETQVRTAGAPAAVTATPDRASLKADGEDVAVVNISLADARGNFTPTACVPVTVTVEGPVSILGGGNGDPAWQATERPADALARTFTLPSFNGLAQVLIQAGGTPGAATVTIEAAGASASVPLTIATERR